MNSGAVAILSLSLIAVLSGQSFADSASSSPTPAAPSRHVNLLKLVDPAKDTLSGQWNLDADALSTDAMRDARIEFPYAPPAEYDYRLEFVAAGDKTEVSSICCAGENQFAWILGGWNNTISGFALFDNRDANANRTKKVADQWITSSEKHVSLVKVRKNRVEAYLDDKLISAVATDYSNMTLAPIFALHDDRALGVEIRSAYVKIQSAEVIEIDDAGKPLRASPTPPPASAGPPLVTSAPASQALALAPDDIKALASAGQYRAALNALNHLLNSPATPAFPYNRHEMLMLRIECMLQLKQNGLAVAMLESLRDAAETTGDLDQEAACGSLALLVKKSTNSYYTPKLGDQQTPIDILNLANRPKLYPLLFTDEFAALQKRCDAAELAPSINPTLELIPAFKSLRCVERLTTSITSQTDSLTASVVSAAAKIINSGLAPFDVAIESISTDAARLIPDNDSRTYRRPRVIAAHSHRAGLTPTQIHNLNAIIAACQRVTKTVTTLGQVFAHEDALKSSAAKAASLQKRAETVLAGDDDPGSAPPTDRLNRNR